MKTYPLLLLTKDSQLMNMRLVYVAGPADSSMIHIEVKGLRPILKLDGDNQIVPHEVLEYQLLSYRFSRITTNQSTKQSKSLK